ncbi:hypothetical protein FACS1894176_10050 [Bacteroidia bacterium]|nr:hypothetical protein FACS1894176_10050 [Bacteroidia bacterium]
MKRSLILSLLFFAAVAGMDAQVTIGSTAAPTPGAVLDLSQGGNLGLILPRAALNNATHYQLGTTNAGADTYTDGTGTVVYNDGTGTLQPAGIYVWNGTDWLAFSSSIPLMTLPLTITISPSTYTFNSPGTVQLSPTVLPAEAVQVVTWKTLNEYIATVGTTGLVTSVGNGDITIQAISTVDETVVGTAQITVNDPNAKKLKIISLFSWGSVTGSTPDGDYPSGMPVTAQVTPNPNFSFDNWYANGVKITDPAAAATYHLTMPTEDLLLEASLYLPAKRTCEQTSGSMWVLPGRCLANADAILLNSVSPSDCMSNGGVWDGTCRASYANDLTDQTGCENMGYEWTNGKCIRAVRCFLETSSTRCPVLPINGGCKWSVADNVCVPRTNCSDYSLQSECTRTLYPPLDSGGCRWSAGACIPR